METTKMTLQLTIYGHCWSSNDEGTHVAPLCPCEECHSPSWDTVALASYLGCPHPEFISQPWRKIGAEDKIWVRKAWVGGYATDHIIQ